MTSATDKFYADQTPENAVALAIADHRAFTKGSPMYEYLSALQKAGDRVAAYPKSIEAIKHALRLGREGSDDKVIREAMVEILAEHLRSIGEAS